MSFYFTQIKRSGEKFSAGFFSRERSFPDKIRPSFFFAVPFISRKSVDEIRARADIVAFIGDYTSLRRAGTKWKGLSPFTDEKTPSFFVDPEKGFYYCFSTGQGGDIFKFLMVRENLTFTESVERVARCFGLTVEYEQRGGNAGERSLRGELFDIHEFSAQYFSGKFGEETELAARVRDYWTRERGFDAETAGEFRVGFLPPEGSRAFADALKKNGFSAKALAASGMFVGTDRTPNPLFWRSRFEARLIVPIADIQRRVVAFTARKIPGVTPEDGRGANEAKYINSSETEIFRKGSTLFNIDKAKDVFAGRRGADGSLSAGTRETPFVLVEGQLDAVRCWKCGIRTAVAGQGTGITEDQLLLLRRYSDRLDCLLDADEAGRKAALRLAPLAFRAGLDLRFLSVPGGKDPDEFLARAGAGGVPAILGSAVPAMTFVARRFFPQDARLTPAQTRAALDEIFGIVAASDSEVFRSDCLVRLALAAGLDRLAVERDFAHFLAAKNAEERFRTGQVSAAVPAPAPPVGGNAPLTTAEDDVLILVLNYDAVTPLFAAAIPPEWLDAESCSGRLLNRIFAEFQEGEWRGAADVHDLLETDEERDFVAKIRNRFEREDWNESDLERIANECLFRLCAKMCERERRRIDRLLGTAEADAAETLELQKKRIALRRILKNPPRIRLKDNTTAR